MEKNLKDESQKATILYSGQEALSPPKALFEQKAEEASWKELRQMLLERRDKCK